MIRILKKSLYFFVAGYFRFFAKIQLKKWHPQVIVITGSNGKTTTLHLLEAQLGAAARYSHHANSSFGIPFDILDLKRTTFAPQEWLRLFVLAPVRAWKKPYEKSVINAAQKKVAEAISKAEEMTKDPPLEDAFKFTYSQLTPRLMEQLEEAEREIK